MIVLTTPLKKSLSDIFQNQKILITGHTGFKGSWLALWLCELGATVTSFSLAPEYPDSHFELLKLKKFRLKLWRNLLLITLVAVAAGLG